MVSSCRCVERAVKYLEGHVLIQQVHQGAEMAV